MYTSIYIYIYVHLTVPMIIGLCKYDQVLFCKHVDLVRCFFVLTTFLSARSSSCMHTPPEPSKSWRHNQTHCQIQNQTRIRFNFHSLSSNQVEFHNQFHFDMFDLYVGFDVETFFSVLASMVRYQ